MAKSIRGQSHNETTVGHQERAASASPTQHVRVVLKAMVVSNTVRASEGVKPMGMAASRLNTSPGTTVCVDTESKQTSNANSSPSCPSNNWGDLVAQIKAGEEVGMEHLYRVFKRGIRYYFCRHIGWKELDDRIHDTLLIVVKAIQSGALREPDALMGYVRTVVHRQVVGYIEHAVRTRRDQTDIEHGLSIPDRNHNPEQQAMATEQTRLVKITLESLAPKDRDILVRFYLKEQSQEQICREMSLTETQFRLRKSRAKCKFGVISRKNLARPETCGSLALLRAS